MDDPLLTSLLALWQRPDPALALRTLEKQAGLRKTFAAHAALAATLSRLPQEFLAAAAEPYAAALFQAREPHKLDAFLVSVPQLSPVLQLFQAWADLHGDRAETALQRLEAIRDGVAEARQALWWRLRAEAAARLEQPDWPRLFREAHRRAQGAEAGHVLAQEGNAFYDHGQRARAIASWSDALAHFHHDPYYSAWLHYNIGMATLRESPLRAERSFQAAESQARRKDGAVFLPRVLCGLGSIRRSLGEWPRAHFNYAEATRIAREPDDLQQAWWGQGHTHRLSRSHSAALRCFQQALAGPKPHDWLHVEIAATHLMLGNLEASQESLSRVGKTTARGRTIEAIVRAELARLSGDPLSLEAALPDIELDTLWAREEQHCFPQLFELLSRQYGRGVEPLNYAQGLEVEVRASGIVHVYVNAREVELKSAGRPVEVLLALLEAGNEATGDQLADLLYAENGRTRKQQLQALWSNVKQLRAVLGWQESVMSHNGHYALDPNAVWRYDMRDPAVRARGNFAEGIYSKWVLEVREAL